MKNRDALIIIAKYPEKGQVKTRIKGISECERVALYERLLKRAMNRLGSLSGVDTFIAFAPETARDYFLPFGVKLIALHPGDLGECMYEAFKDVFHMGYSKAALVGADIPDLSPDVIRNAFEVLSDTDLVYGPASDGGYYLVGMKKLIRDVFESVPWSSDQTLKKSIEQARRSGLTITFTKMLSDIDTIEDVRKAGFLP